MDQKATSRESRFFTYMYMYMYMYVTRWYMHASVYTYLCTVSGEPAAV